MTRITSVYAITAIGLAVFFLPCRLAASEIVPFESANENPLVRIYGLPGSGNSKLIPEGQTEVGLNVALSNNYTANDNSREQIIIDGETSRTTLKVRYGLSSRMEIGVQIPYIGHAGGFLDSFIENYHTALGLPSAGRDQAPRNRLLYRYRRDGIDKILIRSLASGVGDMQLKTAFPLYAEESRSMTFNAALKLPTGDSDQLLGSGSTDLSLWLHEGIRGKFASAGTWASYGSAGILLMTEGKVLPDQQKRWVGFGSLGVGWAPLEWISFKVQADAHTSFFNGSDLREVSSNAVQLIMGGTLNFSERISLDIGVSEDLTVNASPDVVFYFTLRNRF